MIEGLTATERAQVDELGYLVLPGFADRGVCEAMLDRVVEVAQAQAAGAPVLTGPGVAGFVMPEANLTGGGAGDANPGDVVRARRRTAAST